jgi:hypothetical protein
MNLRPWLVTLMAPLGLFLGGSAMYLLRDPSSLHLPFPMPTVTWLPARAQPAASSPTPPGASKTLGATDLRSLVARCRPAGAAELMSPSDFEGNPEHGPQQCAASWKGGDPVRVLGVVDKELAQLAVRHGYRCETGPSFSGGTVDYSFQHTSRSLRNATTTAPVDIWIVRGADSALTLIIRLGGVLTPVR